jgi:5'-deoxynucleotidase YfbR-like HD superfamily hydrolase
MTSRAETGETIYKMRGCVGTTIRTYSGVYFDLVNPTLDMVNISDIARALSNICRFGGQCRKFYSVAEHSMLALDVGKADGLDDRACRSLLLHDAAEAYLGDIVKPLKNLLPDFERLEAGVESVIAEKFGCHFADPRIREIDFSLLIHERRELFSRDQEYWQGQEHARSLDFLRLERLEPKTARECFLDECVAVGIQLN